MRTPILPLICAVFFSATAANADIPKPDNLMDTLGLMLERLQPAFPDAQINRRDRNISLDAEQENIVNPDNIHAVLRSIDDGAEREQALNDFLSTIAASMTAEPLDPENLPLDRILPVVRHESFAQGTAAADLYSEPFVGDMILIYAIDYPDRVAYVTNPNLSGAGLSGAELASIADSNFEAKLDVLRFDSNGISFMAVIDGFYESSLVLDTTFWADTSAQFGDDIVMIVPNRDLLVFVPASEADEVAFLNGLRQNALANGTHQLSELMYIWQGGAWQVYTP